MYIVSHIDSQILTLCIDMINNEVGRAMIVILCHQLKTKMRTLKSICT